MTLAYSMLPTLIDQPITARLAAAGSRRSELEALLEAAPDDANPDELRRLIQTSNVAGKGSAVSRDKVWPQLRFRYLLDPRVPEYRLFTRAMRETSSPSERGLLCFLMFARVNRLFRELTLACISPLLNKQGVEVDSSTIDKSLSQLLSENGQEWTADTRLHIRQHALSALKDFGVLVGSAKKRTVAIRPGTIATLFAATLAKLEGLTDKQVLDSTWFRLLGLGPDQVVSLLYQASREGVLSFRMQAEVVELTLPPLGAE